MARKKEEAVVEDSNDRSKINELQLEYINLFNKHLMQCNNRQVHIAHEKKREANKPSDQYETTYINSLEFSEESLEKDMDLVIKELHTNQNFNQFFIVQLLQQIQTVQEESDSFIKSRVDKKWLDKAVEYENKIISEQRRTILLWACCAIGSFYLALSILMPAIKYFRGL